MTHIPYQYKQLQSSRYFFVSIGKQKIAKVVDFIPLGTRNTVNLAFGDLLPDGSIDDKVISNNGDIVKVLATVIDILKHFTELQPDVAIYFRGSTDDRTKIYTRILRTYYPIFSKEFAIVGIVTSDNKKETAFFEPTSNVEYFAFLIKRIA